MNKGVVIKMENSLLIIRDLESGREINYDFISDTDIEDDILLKDVGHTILKMILGQRKKYRLTYEAVIDIEADNEDEAREKAEAEWDNGNIECYPYIEEITEEN